MVKNMSNENLCECFAYSLAGHDKGRLYVILSIIDDCAYLVDGRLRLISNPKKKKLKHLQIVKSKFKDILYKNNEQFKDTNDEAIKRAIKLFLKKDKEVTRVKNRFD